MSEECELAPEETVLRRFCPTNPDHVIVDEGTGRLRLRSGAVGLRDGESGVSVYRRQVLANAGFADSDIATVGYEGVAAADVEPITASSQMRVRPDPWPAGRLDVPHIDAGHALICAPDGMSKGQIKKQLTLVSRQFRDLSVPNLALCIASLSRAHQ